MMMNQRNPVLLIHGIWDRQVVFQKMAAHLTRQGWSVHCLDLQPNDGRSPLPDLARQVAAYVGDIFTPQQTFDLVGFSMGGLVTRYYLQRLGGNERVERYISISAPNNGTLSAYSSWFPGIQQMRPNSEFLRDLNHDVESALEKIKVTWMWTPFDVMILPANSSYLPIGREVKLSVPLHPWMLSDRNSIQAVETALRE